MAKIKGDDLIVMIEQDGMYHAIAYSTQCDIDIVATTIAVGNPLSGRWPRKKLRYLNWKVTTGHLLSDKQDCDTILSLLSSGRTLNLLFTTVEPHLIPDVERLPDGRFCLSGQALLTRYTVTAKHRDFVTSSATFDGSGESKKLNPGTL